MKEFCITYRQEFIITIQAENREDAILRINRGEGEIEIFGDLVPDFTIIEEEGIDFEVEKTCERCGDELSLDEIKNGEGICFPCLKNEEEEDDN